MKLSFATVALVAALLLVSASQTDATKEHIFLPFHWAGNIVKDAAQYMVAFKLSIATKLLAMITGNRSFRASIEYDSRLEKYQEAPAASGLLYQPAPSVAPRPDPLQVEKDFKVDWFPGFKFPHMHLPKISLPHPHLPSFPKSQQPSAPAVFSIPKFASGYINGGFKIGHGVPANGAVGGQSLQATGPVGLPVAPIVVGTTVLPVTGADSLTKRSVSNSTMGTYFAFIQSNDEGECIARMVCSMAAEPHAFGLYGKKVVRFFDAVKPSKESPASVYKEAARAGHSGLSCSAKYSGCKVDPKHLAHIGSSEF
ncbi:hypothetical protein HPB47_025543 [Ixodes persulcatus]|uniref:Uncharacterized protein n=1 Tax=Ixodes persulcatus TaxID=34615 RepID=A0AC60Q160_IXOPE|nr:hypothetical protein HPB47_025543 [Ixodes persulcatus]